MKEVLSYILEIIYISILTINQLYCRINVLLESEKYFHLMKAIIKVKYFYNNYIIQSEM